MRATLALVLTLFVAGPLEAQSNATLQGRVFDESNAVIAGATVTVRAFSTRFERSISTDGDGRYHVVSIPGGTYQVKAAAAGFRSELRSSIARRWVIQASQLPANSRILNQEPGAWERYKTEIVVAGLLLILQTALIAALLFQRSQRRQTEGRNDAILRAVPDLMFLQTMDGVYVDCHAADPGRLFLRPDQFIGKSMRDVLPPALLREVEPAFARAAGTLKPVVFEYDLEVSDGQRRFEARLVRCNDNQILTLVRDVTERQRAETALHESAQRYRLASTAGSVGVWDWNFDTDELYVDPGLKALLGFEDGEISSRPEDWGSRVHPDDLPLSAARVKACVDGETDVYEVEHRMLHKDGSARWFLSRGSAIRGENGAIRRLVGTKVDITERKRSADQFRLALEATTTGMLMVSRTGRIVLVNAHIERLFGYRREELLNAPVDRVLPERPRGTDSGDRRGFRWDADLFATPQQRELEGVRKGGETIPLEIGFSPLQTAEGEFVLCSIADITERRQAERERDDLTTQLRDLAGRLIAAQEAERTRIARDLHDDVSQQLAALSIAFSGLKRHAAASPAGAGLEAEVALLQQRTNGLAESIRDLSHDLHPDVIRHAGLAASLVAYCESLSLPEALSVTCEAQGDFAAIDQAAAICLYRITQEALHNVVKHANARHAGIKLFRTPDGAELTVWDDGNGFDVQIRKTSPGLGLVSIAERARLAGGTVSIVTALNKGTQVHVHVPIAAHAPPEATDPSGGFAGAPQVHSRHSVTSSRSSARPGGKAPFPS